MLGCKGLITRKKCLIGNQNRDKNEGKFEIIAVVLPLARFNTISHFSGRLITIAVD